MDYTSTVCMLVMGALSGFTSVCTKKYLVRDFVYLNGARGHFIRRMRACGVLLREYTQPVTDHFDIMSIPVKLSIMTTSRYGIWFDSCLRLSIFPMRSRS